VCGTKLTNVLAISSSLALECEEFYCTVCMSGTLEYSIGWMLYTYFSQTRHVGTTYIGCNTKLLQL